MVINRPNAQISKVLKCVSHYFNIYGICVFHSIIFICVKTDLYTI
jgi:hypothetical protein